MATDLPAENGSSNWDRWQVYIALLATLSIAVHLMLRYVGHSSPGTYNLPLWIALGLGGGPLVVNLLIKLYHREFGSDLLAGISILTSIFLGEYLAGTLVVLMLSGGEALEAYAVQNASSVLKALANRIPSEAHLRKDDLDMIDIPLEEVAIGDRLVILPHEICPVDGTVIAGQSVMDESYLTGEPFLMSKTIGSPVLSGAINGENALTIQADKLVIDSRYAKIMQVMQASEQKRPKLRRLGDQLGAYYTPVALAFALLAWAISGEAIRFLAVLVVATPCPLLIAIPVTIIGSISLSARRGIIVKDPVALEKIDTCRTILFDKTGTLTYGRPKLTEIVPATGFNEQQILALVANLERYSKHPLSSAVERAAQQRETERLDVSNVSERPGEGLRGTVDQRQVQITSRKKLMAVDPGVESQFPSQTGGLECLVVVDNRYAATMRFRDELRTDGAPFIHHLASKHHFQKTILLSGDRESEVRYLADLAGIKEIHFGKSPEEKLEIVREETKKANTIFVGDGINDAPALLAATVGIASGQSSDITTESASVVVMDSSLKKVDEFFHISRRMRSIALQSALGGIAFSLAGMLAAALGFLPPVSGAVLQEIIDVAAILNAARAAVPPKHLSDY